MYKLHVWHTRTYRTIYNENQKEGQVHLSLMSTVVCTWAQMELSKSSKAAALAQNTVAARTFWKIQFRFFGHRSSRPYLPQKVSSSTSLFRQGSQSLHHSGRLRTCQEILGPIGAHQAFYDISKRQGFSAYHCLGPKGAHQTSEFGSSNRSRLELWP